MEQIEKNEFIHLSNFRIRPLKWTKTEGDLIVSTNGIVKYVIKTNGLSYIHIILNEYEIDKMLDALSDPINKRGYKTIELAKQHCQSDHEQRVLKFLDPMVALD